MAQHTTCYVIYGFGQCAHSKYSYLPTRIHDSTSQKKTTASFWEYHKVNTGMWHRTLFYVQSVRKILLPPASGWTTESAVSTALVPTYQNIRRHLPQTAILKRSVHNNILSPNKLLYSYLRKQTPSIINSAHFFLKESMLTTVKCPQLYDCSRFCFTVTNL